MTDTPAAGRKPKTPVEMIGNRKLMDREGIALGSLSGDVDRLAADGKTAMYVAADGQALGVVAVADTIRASARQAVHGRLIRPSPFRPISCRRVCRQI